MMDDVEAPSPTVKCPQLTPTQITGKSYETLRVNTEFNGGVTVPTVTGPWRTLLAIWGIARLASLTRVSLAAAKDPQIVLASSREL